MRFNPKARLDTSRVSRRRERRAAVAAARCRIPIPGGTKAGGASAAS